MLADRLNKLVKLQILAKHPYQERGNRTRNAYRLTRSGRALGKILIAMTEWGEDNLTHSTAPAQITDASTGRRLRLGFVDEEGRAVEGKNVRLTVMPPVEKGSA